MGIVTCRDPVRPSIEIGLTAEVGSYVHGGQEFIVWANGYAQDLQDLPGCVLDGEPLTVGVLVFEVAA